MPSDLYLKYLKYKNKYIQLKNELIGGGPTWIRFGSSVLSDDKAFGKLIGQMKPEKEEGVKAFNELNLIMQGYSKDVTIKSTPCETMDELNSLIKNFEASKDYKAGQEGIAKNNNMSDTEYAKYYTPEIKSFLKWAYDKYIIRKVEYEKKHGKQ